MSPTVEGCTVIMPGEKAAGLSEYQWEIRGGFIFEDKQEREEFRQAIKDAFDLVTGGGHYVVFGDEWPKEPCDDFSDENDWMNSH